MEYQELRYHPVSNIFPLMQGDEFESLKADIKVNGQNEPIYLYDGMILDGRNRYIACMDLEIEPTFKQYAGDDPRAFVISMNLHRRHLNETQRAGVAAKIANMRQGERTDIEPYANLHKVISIPQAAEMLNVGKRTVATYKSVAAAMPELIEMMDRGEMTAHEAMKEVKKRERDSTRADMAAAGAMIEHSDRWHIYQGDIATWKAPRQYDFIITDPPYSKEYLPLWGTLAERAKEWLKPGGLLIAMSGQSYLDEIYSILGKYLTYYWTAAYLTPGQPTPMRQVNVNTSWKPLLIYSNDKYTGKIFGDVFLSEGNDKNYHNWGQSKSGMLSIIQGICLPGQYILDPFCGAGTTGMATLKHGCLFDGLDMDIENVNISRSRMAE